MPCYDGRDEHERLYRDRQAAARVEAVLCAVVTAFALKNVLANINLAECGVTKEWIEDWWAQHQRRAHWTTSGFLCPFTNLNHL